MNLINSFPVIRGQFMYSVPLDPLKWLLTSVYNIGHAIVYGDYWLSRRIHASRYGLVPLANLDS